MVEQTVKKILPLPIEILLPEDNVKWSSVSLSEVLARNSRLEASVYDIKGKQARETLANCRWEIVNLWSDKGLIDSAWYPTRFKRIYVGKHGIPFFLPSQLNEVYPKPSKFISERTSTNLETIKVKRNQLLLTRSGTIGNCTIVTSTIEDKVFSDDVIRITSKNPNDVGYIYAFFKTETGQTLIQTNNYGAVVSHIEPHHLAEIPIPNPQAIIKIEIHNLVMASFALRDESNELLDQAEQLLIDELSLPPLEELKTERFDNKAEIKNFTVKLSELSERLEASYHKPIVRAISEHITKYADEVTILGDSCIAAAIMLPSRFKRVYVETGQGVLFFGGKELFQLAPNGEKFLSLKHHSERIKNELTLEENTLLISRSGTIGRITITPKHWEGWMASEHIIRVVPTNKDIAGYIYAWLNTDYGKELLTRFTYGAVVDEIDHRHIAQVEIPLLKNKDVQQKINDLVLEANQKRYEAYILEQKAIHTINEKVIFAE